MRRPLPPHRRALHAALVHADLTLVSLARGLGVPPHYFDVFSLLPSGPLLRFVLDAVAAATEGCRSREETRAALTRYARDHAAELVAALPNIRPRVRYHHRRTLEPGDVLPVRVRVHEAEPIRPAAAPSPAAPRLVAPIPPPGPLVPLFPDARWRRGPTPPRAPVPADACARIAALRLRLGWRRSDLAARIGVTFATMRRWRPGRLPPPKHWTALLALAQRHGVADVLAQPATPPPPGRPRGALPRIIEHQQLGTAAVTSEVAIPRRHPCSLE